MEDHTFAHVVFTINLQNPEPDVKRLTSQIYGVDAAKIQLKEFKQGNTNRLFLARFSKQDPVTGTDQKFERLCRVYGEGTHHLIDRDFEVKIMKRFTADGHSPILYQTFENGMFYEFLPGRSISNAEQRDTTIARWIAKAIGHWHQRELPEEKVIQTWITLRKWLGKAQAEQKVLTQDEMKSIADEVEMIIKTLSKLYEQSTLVTATCCHNDLTADNILMEKQQSTSDEGKIAFIDMEYCSYNFNAFDLGNLFCEWAGLATEWNYYPNPDQQKNIVQAYLSAWLGRDPTEQEIQDMCVAANRFALVSHLFWGLWGLYQAAKNPGGVSPNGFNYVNYAKSRLGEYSARRDSFLKLSG